MAISSRVWIWFVFLSAVVLHAACAAEEAEEVSPSHVLTLDASNFDETVAKHPFIVVEFYAPWCGHCKKLAPEYEKAAAALSKHEPPIVLAKVDANEEANKGFASKYGVKGYPTIKILRNEGKNIQEYKGPREADGIVEFLKKQAGPASAEIKSAEDANSLIDEKKVFIVGVFPEFSGEEFDNFIKVAEKLRSEYDFGHTLEAKLLPKGKSAISRPVIRILKPFDEHFVDSKDFNVDALETFIEEASMPLVTLFNKDPNNHPYVVKFFGNANAKAMLFMNFSSESTENFKSKLREVAENYKGEKISFLLGDVDTSQRAFQYFGLREDQVPLMVIQKTDGQKYLKANLDPLHIADWLKEYMDGNLKPYIKSEPIPEVNDEPVKVVVADSLDDVVLESGKNVLLEFYAPWCGHCQKLAPILDEVAVSLESDPSVIIAKIDATANDIPTEFGVQGYPTLYFLSATGKHVQYNGSRTKEDIIEFIQKNRDTTLQSDSVQTDTVKDEL